MNKYVDSAHGGIGWVEREDCHENEIGSIWNKCGVKSDTDRLKSVLLRRPGKEIENITKPEVVLWSSIMDPVKARYQHDNLAETYKNLGIEVNYINEEAANNFPNIIYVRDIFTMTPQGAILSRLASKARSGEERIVLTEIAKRGMPIIASAHNDMYLEGPDIILVNKDLVFLGIGIRTNIQAVNFVSDLLRLQGYSDIKLIQTTYGCGHLDGVINLINSKYAAIVPQRVSYEVYIALKRHGYTIIELPNLFEVDNQMSINFVPVDNETIIINKGAKETLKSYKKCGVNCIEVDVSELMKGGGSVHCLTGVLWREN